MSKKVLQVNFKFNGSFSQFEQPNLEAAKQIAQIPGLRWKIWPYNETEGEAAGIYLFDDEAAAQSYMEQVAPTLEGYGLSDISTKLFDVSEGPTAITRGPV